MTDNTDTKTENTDTKTENTAMNMEKPKRGRPAKSKEKTQEKPTLNAIEQKEFAEFMAWKKQKEEATVTASSEHDPVYAKYLEEKRLVKGVFRCREPEGGSVMFSVRPYKWDPTRTYTMVDGETYEVPLYVARHLNRNCNCEVHSNILGPDGNPTLDRSKKRSRMNFESMEFNLL